MMDEVEYRSLAMRPRQLAHGPYRIPSAVDLGWRLAALRRTIGIGVLELALAANLRNFQIEEFEEYGSASAETLLTLVEALCPDDRLGTAFGGEGAPGRTELIARGLNRIGGSPIRFPLR